MSGDLGDSARSPGETSAPCPGPGSPRATSFGAAAEAYGRFRPGPASAGLDWVLGGDAADLLDVGAGTGAMTALLAARGARVTAVEPDARMRSILARTAPSATILAGSAERLPVADASQDAILAHSAWHWFDPGAAAAEAARALRDGGRLGVLITGLDPEDGWARELWHRLEPGASSVRRTARVRRMAGAVRRQGRRRARAAVLGAAAQRWFDPEEGPHEVRFTRDLTRVELVGWAGTYSGLLARPPAERAALLDDVAAAFDARRDTSPSPEAVVPLLTRCWRTRRRPR